MKIIKVINNEEKKKITRAILEALPEWFGIVAAREEYILDSVGKDFFCAMEKDKVVGFLYLKQTGKDTIELAVMGVLKEYHRKGIGRALFEYAKESIKESGYSFIHFPLYFPLRIQIMLFQFLYDDILLTHPLQLVQPYLYPFV